jgi:hydroxymethylpyrimidine pyrophosphatase-like HAD family hydrolase
MRRPSPVWRAISRAESGREEAARIEDWLVRESATVLRWAMARFKTLLSFDLDGTILGDPDREVLFRSWAIGRPAGIALAYASGRSAVNMRAEIASGRLARPDFIIGHLGTVIERADGPAPDLLDELLSGVQHGWSARAVLLAGPGAGVETQEPERLNDYKASFYWDGRPESLEAFYSRLRKRLPDGCWRSMEVEGLYIDVLPSCVGKAGATLAVARSLRLGPGDVVVAGDSENDQDLFLEPGFRKILPSNAVELLARLAPEAYHSPYPDAAGVLDGLKAFGIIA